MFTTVAVFRDPWEAHMLCGRLAAEGIPAIVAHSFHVGNKWAISIALGGVKVQVPSGFASDARDIDSLCRSGEFRALLETVVGDLDDVRCPKCRSTELEKRRSLPRAVLAIIFSAWCWSVFPPAGWVYFCKDCGWSFTLPSRAGAVRRWFCVAAVIVAFVLALLFLLYWIDTLFGCSDTAPCYALKV